jgi:hypothetical protein
VCALPRDRTSATRDHHDAPVKRPRLDDACWRNCDTLRAGGVAAEARVRDTVSADSRERLADCPATKSAGWERAYLA